MLRTQQTKIRHQPAAREASFQLTRCCVFQVGESQNMDLTVANAYNLPGTEERVRSSPRRPKAQAHENKHFSFEDLDGSLNETVDSEVSAVLGPEADRGAKFGAVQNLNKGKIVFGEPDLLQTILDSADLREGEDSKHICSFW